MKNFSVKCRITGREFLVSEQEQAHLDKMFQTNPCLKEPLPLPTVHPYEELRRQCAFANYLNLFKSKSALSGRNQLTRHNPELGNKICTVDEFWSDAIDNSQFGRPYCFDRPFFEQWRDLVHDCYLLPLNNFNTEGSSYVNGATNVSNSYLCFNIIESQDCMYCFSHHRGSDNVDCVGATSAQFCYSCVDIENCYECQHCQDCKNSNNCFYCLDLIGCKYCIGCVGLRNTEYCIRNDNVGRQAYFRFLKEHELGDRHVRTSLIQSCDSFIAEQKHEVNRIINCEESSGDYLTDCKNSHECFFSQRLHDCGYLVQGYNSKDSWKGIAISSELTYKSMSVRGYHDLYSYVSTDGSYNVYCYMLANHCANCFGSVGLKSKSYCILNKQYTKEEYFDLVPRIIEHMKTTGEWGEFFPPAYSTHAYHASVACDIFEGLSESTLMKRGYRVLPQDEPAAQAGETSAKDIPDRSSDIAPGKLLEKRFVCEKTSRPFTYQKKELDFYVRFKIPPPRIHWKERIENLNQKRRGIPAV